MCNLRPIPIVVTSASRGPKCGPNDWNCPGACHDHPPRKHSLTNDLTVNTILAVGDPLVVATGVNVALDETAGLQNAAATPAPTGTPTTMTSC